MKLIERASYLKQLQNVIGTPDIKVITGVRRSGKSKLMDAFISLLEKDGAPKNIVRIKLNLKQFEALTTGDELYRYIDERYREGAANYLFIEEVQICDGLWTHINSLYEEESFVVYLTGS